MLELQNNALESLPENLNELKSLERLDFSHNRLKSIPVTVCQLIHLKELKLLENPIKSIRSDILRGGTARILKYLRESQKFVSTDPEKPGEKPSTPCSLSHASNTYVKIRNKKCLDLQSTTLQDIPDLSKMILEAKKAEVSTLDLRGNQLHQISDDFKELSEHVNEINLSENMLEVLPGFLGDFNHLIYLNVSCNRLEDLPDELGCLKMLKELDVSFNK